MEALYFAYGSNLLPSRLENRVGPFETVGIASCSGYSFAFHKIGKDGSGKGDMYLAVQPEAQVFGVVYRLDERQRLLLDGFEGDGYAVVDIAVQGPSGNLAAYTYMAKPNHIDTTLRPFRWYRDLVIHGAKKHVLPDSYVAVFERTAVIDDPDQSRAQVYYALLDD